MRARRRMCSCSRCVAGSVHWKGGMGSSAPGWDRFKLPSVAGRAAGLDGGAAVPRCRERRVRCVSRLQCDMADIKIPCMADPEHGRLQALQILCMADPAHGRQRRQRRRRCSCPSTCDVPLASGSLSKVWLPPPSHPNPFYTPHPPTSLPTLRISGALAVQQALRKRSSSDLLSATALDALQEGYIGRGI